MIKREGKSYESKLKQRTVEEQQRKSRGKVEEKQRKSRGKVKQQQNPIKNQ